MLAKRIKQKKGKVFIFSETTDEPITLMGAMAGQCWNSDTTNHNKNFKRGLDCIKSQHGRVMEYPQIYIKLDGYSARVIRELYTHLGGLPTRLQTSTRYVDCHDFGYVVPPSVKNNVEALGIYNNLMENIQNSVSQLEEMGIPREDTALMLPLGMETKVVIRLNLRMLYDMAHQRLCTRAYWEFRELMNDLLDSLAFYSDEWKYLIEEVKLFVPKCEHLGYCPEKHSCGRKGSKEDIDNLINDGKKINTIINHFDNPDKLYVVSQNEKDLPFEIIFREEE